MTSRKKKVFSLSLGCAKNQVDAEHAAAELASAGFKFVETAEKSDIILINTCGFIKAAKEESIETIFSLLKNKKENQKTIVYGCLSKRYKEELEKEIPEVDFWLGNYQAGMFLNAIGRKRLATKCRLNPPKRMKNTSFPHHGYLKIAEGCNRACSFCAIPSIRGLQVSQTIESLVEEAKQLEENGVMELSLIAQDLSSYGTDLYNKPSLEALLEALLKNTNIPWIRLMYLYPEYITDSLLNLMATENRICKYADIPIQHASDKMLKLMRRKYSAKSLKNLLFKMRERVPGISLRTTVLIGFPGETHEDFEELMQLAEEVCFEHLGGFVWSPEEGTAAINIIEKPVGEREAMLRLNAIIELQDEISLYHNEKLIGQTLEVILDTQKTARTKTNAIEVDDIVNIVNKYGYPRNGIPGTLRQVKILSASPHDLEGVLL